MSKSVFSASMHTAYMWSYMWGAYNNNNILYHCAYISSVPMELLKAIK